MKKLLPIVGVLVSVVGCAADPYQHKALANVHQASLSVGDFSPGDRAAYSAGIEYVKQRHERLGGFTIAQVISMGETALDSKKKRQEAAISAAAVRGEQSDLEAMFRLMNSSTSGKLVDSYSVQDNILRVVVNGDVYEYLSRQDQDLMKQNIDNGWNISYNQRHHTKDAFTSSFLHDEAGNSL